MIKEILTINSVILSKDEKKDQHKCQVNLQLETPNYNGFTIQCNIEQAREYAALMARGAKLIMVVEEDSPEERPPSGLIAGLP